MTHPPAQAPPAPKGRLSRTLRRTVSTLLTLEAAIGVVEKPRMQDTINVE